MSWLVLLRSVCSLRRSSAESLPSDLNWRSSTRISRSSFSSPLASDLVSSPERTPSPILRCCSCWRALTARSRTPAPKAVEAATASAQPTTNPGKNVVFIVVLCYRFKSYLLDPAGIPTGYPMRRGGEPRSYLGARRAADILLLGAKDFLGDADMWITSGSLQARPQPSFPLSGHVACR